MTNWSTKPGFIYAIQARILRHIKIGFSVRPGERLIDLQICSPDMLDLIGLWKGTMTNETILHRKFSKRQLHGEWFQECPELLKRIAELNNEKLRQKHMPTTPINGNNRLARNQARFDIPTCQNCREILRTVTKTEYGYPQVARLYKVRNPITRTEGGHQWYDVGDGGIYAPLCLAARKD